MRYDKIKNYKPEKFRRLTGVKSETFSVMVEVLIRAYAVKHGSGGRSSKLSMEDMLLATLGYLREYRTYAHIAADFGISESILFRAVRWVENTLIKDGRFHLPGRKALVKSDYSTKRCWLRQSKPRANAPKKTAETV
jgi:transposase-like protein